MWPAIKCVCFGKQNTNFCVVHELTNLKQEFEQIKNFIQNHIKYTQMVMAYIVQIELNKNHKRALHK